MKKYNENDKIEIYFERTGGYNYKLQWRYKEPKKFLWFEIQDKWKGIMYYTNDIDVAPYREPNEPMYWRYHGFNLLDEASKKEYDWIKENIKTKKELFDYFKVQENITKYYKDLHEYNEFLKKK